MNYKNVRKDTTVLESQQTVTQIGLYPGKNSNKFIKKKNLYSQKNSDSNLTLPGEYCAAHQQCLSGLCSGGICVGKAEGESCSWHGICDIGLFCNKSGLTDYEEEGICAEQAIFGESCTEDYGCLNNCVCNLGRCAYYFTNDNGIEADNADSCLSGYIEEGFCKAGRVSDIKGRTCSTDQDCLLLNSSGLPAGYSECSCGFNAGGISYCELSEGDSEFQAAIRQFQYILERSQGCHTWLRKGPCKELYNEEYVKFHRLWNQFQMYPKITFNDPCIRELITYEYWQLGGSIREYWLGLIILIGVVGFLY